MKNQRGATIIEILFVLAALPLFFGAVVCSLIGIVLAFSSSIILGFASFLLPPSFSIYGLLWLFGKNVPEIITNWLHLPF